MAALVQAGIEPTDFDHIIFASSGSFAGMGFVLGRMSGENTIVDYCREHGPSETIHFPTMAASIVPNVMNLISSVDVLPASVRKIIWFFSKKVTHVLEKAVGKKIENILQVEDLLSRVLTGRELKNPQEWYETPVLPPDYHTARPDGKKNPVIHVVTTTTGEHPQSRYIRSDRASPEEFQKALAATLTIPRWSEPIRKVGEEELIDGYFSDPVMYDYARTLGGSHIVKLWNHNGPHLEPESNEKAISYWLDKFPFLAKFYAKKRPHDIHNQIQRMYTDSQEWKVRVLFAEPLPDAFENPLLTGRRTGFYENILTGLQTMRSMLLDEKYTLPELRTVKQKTLFDTLEEMIEALYNMYQIGR